MSERGQMRVLGVCAALALLAHVGVLAWPTWVAIGGAKSPDARGREPEVDRQLPEREVELGRPDARTPSVAWISYEDYRELVAPKARTEQPAVQQEVDPVDDAPVEPDPTPPAPTPAEQPTVADAAELAEPPVAMPREVDPPPLPEFEAVGELPRPRPEADPSDEAVEPNSQRAESTRADDAAPASGHAQPTAAPRTEADAEPTQIDPDELEHRADGVIVGPGIEVRPARLRVRPSMHTAFPRNPVVRIYFNDEGKVDKAEIVRSTGFGDWDGTILASLYRWRAEGDAINAADPHVMIEIQYLLHDITD